MRSPPCHPTSAWCLRPRRAAGDARFSGRWVGKREEEQLDHVLVVERVVQNHQATDVIAVSSEQPATFTLVVNLKTAKAFGIALPRSTRARADQAIEYPGRSRRCRA